MRSWASPAPSLRELLSCRYTLLTRYWRTTGKSQDTAAALKAISEPHEPSKQAQAGPKPGLKFRRPREKNSRIWWWGVGDNARKKHCWCCCSENYLEAETIYIFFVLTTPRVQYSRFTASKPSYPKPLKGWTDRLAPARWSASNFSICCIACFTREKDCSVLLKVK